MKQIPTNTAHTRLIRVRTSAAPAVLRLICVTAALAAATMLSGCNKSTAKSTSSTAATTAATTTTTATTAAPTSAAAGTWGAFPAPGWCSATTLNVRKTPDTTYFSIGGLKYGDKVSVLGKEGDWFKISFKGGVAYVSAAFISPTEITVTGTTAVASATVAAG